LAYAETEPLKNSMSHVHSVISSQVIAVNM